MVPDQRATGGCRRSITRLGMNGRQIPALASDSGVPCSARGSVGEFIVGPDCICAIDRRWPPAHIERERDSLCYLVTCRAVLVRDTCVIGDALPVYVFRSVVALESASCEQMVVRAPAPDLG